jgi:hypothetical protein
MRSIQMMKSLWGGVAASALIFTYGCGAAQNPAGVRAQAQEIAATQAGSPVVVSCEPSQRTLVRPVVMNGATISQIECVAADPQAARYVQANTAAQPVPAGHSYAAQPAYRDLAPAQIVPVQRPASAARPIRTRQVVYDDPVEVKTKKRSVKKSVAIIGGSAAVGAGVGALAKGKKGALIGAAVGGGGATIWDQITRR